VLTQAFVILPVVDLGPRCRVLADSLGVFDQVVKRHAGWPQVHQPTLAQCLLEFWGHAPSPLNDIDCGWNAGPVKLFEARQITPKDLCLASFASNSY
jgi:hypothetical protein